MDRLKNLGKFFIFSLLSSNLYGEHNLSVDKPLFLQGDEVTLSIVATGEKIEMKELKKIGEFPIIHSHNGEEFIDLSQTQKVKKIEYTFIPNRTLYTPTIELTIDSKTYKLDPIKIEKIAPTISKKTDQFYLSFEFGKNEYYIGEPFIGKLIFGYIKESEIIKQSIEPFFGEHFDIKLLDEKRRTLQNGYESQEMNYLFIPKKVGLATLQHQFIEVKYRENKTNYKKRIFSDLQNLSILPIPNDIRLVGDFKLEAIVDTTTPTKNQPVNLTIAIKGEGDLSKIKPFRIDLPDQIVFDSKPKVETYFQNDKYFGTFTQKIAISTKTDFKIPHFELQYFDLKTKKIKTLQSDPIDIIIKNDAQEVSKIDSSSNEKEIKTLNSEKKQNTNPIFGYLELLIGSFVGLVFIYLLIKIKPKKEKNKKDTLETKIKKAKNDKELYDLLLTYVNDKKFQVFIKQLELNIYFQKNEKIDKKALLKLINPIKRNIEDEL